MLEKDAAPGPRSVRPKLLKSVGPSCESCRNCRIDLGTCPPSRHLGAAKTNAVTRLRRFRRGREGLYSSMERFKHVVPRPLNVSERPILPVWRALLTCRSKNCG